MRINANFNYIVAKRPAIFKVVDFGIWEEYLRLMPFVTPLRIVLNARIKL